MVPGDGACAPNCAAAFFFQDEVFGPKLRKIMNCFQAKYWFKKYQYNFSAQMCWWNHNEKTLDSDENLKCFICKKILTSKPEMMKHR